MNYYNFDYFLGKKM